MQVGTLEVDKYGTYIISVPKGAYLLDAKRTNSCYKVFFLFDENIRDTEPIEFVALEGYQPTVPEGYVYLGHGEPDGFIFYKRQSQELGPEFLNVISRAAKMNPQLAKGLLIKALYGEPRDKNRETYSE